VEAMDMEMELVDLLVSQSLELVSQVPLSHTAVEAMDMEKELVDLLVSQNLELVSQALL
jgi:hypothetical protein